MTEVITPKNIFYIKLNSEADMPTAFDWAYKQDSHKEVDEETGEETVVLDGDPYLVPYTREYSIDVIGVMQEPTGNMLTDGEGNEYPEQVDVDGWHVNIKLHGESEELRDIIEALDASNGANPVTPDRGWL